MTEVFDSLVIPVVVSKFRLPGKHILRWGFGFRELQYALWDNMLESKRNRIGQRSLRNFGIGLAFQSCPELRGVKPGF